MQWRNSNFAVNKYSWHLQILWCNVKIWRRWCIKNILTSFAIFKKKVKPPNGKDKQSYKTIDADAGKRTDDNFDDRIHKFADQLQTEFYYRIPLRFLCSLGLINQTVEFNTTWLLTFETDYQRLFESKAKQANDALPEKLF